MKYTAYQNRKDTDKLFTPADNSAKYEGYLSDSVYYIEKEQLTDPALWILFVQQFKIENVDSKDNGWRGEYWGKMMRGACFTYSYTQNEELYGVLEQTVRDLLTAQDKLGRFSTYTVEREFHGWDIWSRKYIMLGFQYFLEICKDDELADAVVAAMCRHADYMVERIGNNDPKKIPITYASDDWLGLNSSSILEPFVRLYNITGEKKYFDFATEIVEAGGMKGFNMFESALEGKVYPFEYPTTKAYEMMSVFEGIIEYYRVTKEEKYKTMAINFARLVIDSDITVIGSAGTTHELFDHSKVTQFNPKYDGVMQETCVSVTWMKLCYQLLCLTGDSKYADQIEKTVYNALVGAVNVKKNKCFKNEWYGGEIFTFDSYSPLLNSSRGRYVGGFKDIVRDRFWWGCCVAIGAAGTGLIPMTATMRKCNGAAINLFIQGSSSTALANGSTVTLTTETNYPCEGKVSVTVDTDSKDEFTVSVRIPEWSKDTKLSVNGEAVNTVSGAYADICRKWSKGDKIELVLDMRTEIIRAADLDPSADEASICHAALRRGPIMLARDSMLGEDITEAVALKDNGGYAELTEGAEAPFDCRMYFRVALENGESVGAVDYASCGQTWDYQKPVTVWFTTK